MKVRINYRRESPASPFYVAVSDDSGNMLFGKRFANPDTAISAVAQYSASIPADAFAYAEVNGLWRSDVEGDKNLSMAVLDLEIQRLQNLRRAKLVEAAAATADAIRADHEQLRLGQLNAKLDKYNITFAESRKLRLQGRLRALNPEILGGIEGLPTMQGLLIASDGVIGILIRGPKLWAEVHVAHFVPEEGQDDSELKGMKKERVAKPPKSMEELIKDLANLV